MWRRLKHFRTAVEKRATDLESMSILFTATTAAGKARGIAGTALELLGWLSLRTCFKKLFVVNLIINIIFSFQFKENLLNNDKPMKPVVSLKF